jgi:hypothetical protein
MERDFGGGTTVAKGLQKNCDWGTVISSLHRSDRQNKSISHERKLVTGTA